MYKAGIGKAWASLGARRLGLPRANIKIAGGKGLTPFPPAWKRSDCGSLCALGLTPLAEAH